MTKLILNEREISRGVIRKATANEVPKLVDVDCNCNSVVIKRLNASKEQIEYTVQKRFNDKSKEFYVYELDGKIVGYATVNFEDNTGEREYNCEISWIAVKKEFQCMGIGKKLVNFMENAAKNKSYRNVHIYTSERDNEDAQKFYLSLGYRRIKVTDEYYADGTRAVLYGKEI